MPLRIAMLVLLCAAPLPLRPAAADAPFPYTGYINADDVYVRSGPGKNYYPTGKLPRGEAVEVYRHDPGGWYAVRPPEGSFSWVAADLLQPLEENIGEVTGDRVVARVGTEFSDTRDVIQVRLYRGEEVEILEAKRFGSGPAAQTWYKIAPPAGEFRWIHGEFIDREPPERGPRGEETSGNLLIEKMERGVLQPEAPRRWNEADQQRSRSYDRDEEYAEHRAPREARGAEAQEFGDVEHREPLDADIEATLPPRRHRRDHGDQDEAPSARVTGVTPRHDTQLAGDVRELPIDEELDEIDFALSLMVTEEPGNWDLAPLARRTRDAFARSETSLHRGRARLLMKRIARFEEIQQRQDQLIAGRPPLETPRREATTVARRTPTLPATSAASSRFDGVGRLAQVDSGRPAAPNYALVDPNGAVQAYVTPAPGLNLRHYVGREVGLNGALGYVPEFGTQHVTARRVTVLDGRILR